MKKLKLEINLTFFMKFPFIPSPDNEICIQLQFVIA